MKVDAGRTAVVVLAIWGLVVVAFMLLNRTLDLEVFFVLILIGMLVVVELADTATVQPATVRRAKSWSRSASWSSAGSSRTRSWRSWRDEPERRGRPRGWRAGGS